MSPLDPELWRRIDAALDRLLDLTGSARAAELDRITALDPELRPHLDALVRADARVHGPLDTSAAALIEDLARATGAPTSDRPLPEVPRYRILQEIGSGGMGTVYRAERADGRYEQTVALKVLREGLDKDVITRRFELERRILAKLEHPGIARLLDGDITADGHPYFVMEYVDGRPITEFADAERLDVRQRIVLFAEACIAVAHAQRHLIVHRDLKPSNILVTATQEVKLLDFGIAKPLDAMADEALDLTHTGMYLLTPAYAAPEQLRGEAVTTATDVYALGVVLYELLSGRRPYRVIGRSPGLLELAVLEQEPEPLAQAVTRSDSPDSTLRAAASAGASTDEIAAARRASPLLLRRQLQGELAHIVHRCMRKDPTQRYSSAADLLDDLHNYLSGRPVVAQGDSVAYRMRKFLLRYRVGVAAAAMVFLALAAGLTATAWQAREASRQAARVTQVKDFLIELFEGADPNASPGTELSATDLLARGAERLETALLDEPEVRAELLQLVGTLYLQLGRYEAARPLLERSVELHTALHGANGSQTIAALKDVGVAAVHAGDYAVAESLLTRCLEIERRSGHDRRAAIARLLNDLGVIRARLADATGAEALYREALALDREVYGDDHLDVATDLDNLGVLLASQRRFDEALPLHREALEIRRRLVTGDHTTIGTSLHNLAHVLEQSGETAAADSVARETIELRRRLYPRGHPHLAASLKALAQIEYARGRFDAADSLLTEALEMNRRLLGDAHEEVAALLNEQGMVDFGRKDLHASEVHFAASLAIWEQILPADHPSLLSVRNNLAYALRVNGKYAQAEQHCRQLLAVRLAAAGADDPGVAYERVILGIVLRLDGRPDEALHELELAVATRSEHPEVTALDVAHSRFHLGAALVELGRHADAEVVLRPALATFLEELGADAPRLAEARCALGSSLLAQGRSSEADALIAAGLDVLGPDLAHRDPIVRRAAQEWARWKERRH